MAHPNKTMEQWLEEMKTQFWRKGSDVVVRMQLDAIKQAPTESVEAYGIRVMNLIELNRLNMTEKEKIYHFAKGLQKSLMKHVYEQQMTIGDMTYIDVLHAAMTKQSVQQLSGGGLAKNPSTSIETVNSMHTMQEREQSRQQRYPPRQAEVYPRQRIYQYDENGRPICFRCKVAGHKGYECEEYWREQDKQQERKEKPQSQESSLQPGIRFNTPQQER